MTVEVLGSAPLWIACTLAIWIGAEKLHEASGKILLTNPIAVSIIVLIGVILLTGEPAWDYAASTRPITFLTGPATVALAIPIQRHLRTIVQLWFPIGVALLAGAAASLSSSLCLGSALGLSSMTTQSLLPKSVTAPVAMALATPLGGSASLVMISVLITGISGSILLPLLRPRDADGDHRGWAFSAGVAAHNFGVAKAIEADALSGAVATIGMALNAVFISMLLISR